MALTVPSAPGRSPPHPRQLPRTLTRYGRAAQAAKRALYTMLLHAGLPLDVVVEEDIGTTLDSYAVIYLADTHVSDAASAALVAWVKAGGTLIGTAGAGMFNEVSAVGSARRLTHGWAHMLRV